MDTFFTQTNCDRCGGSLDEGRMMSRFNKDCLCMACIKAEKSHPKYKEAEQAELEAVKRGVRNYPGIGYPTDGQL